MRKRAVLAALEKSLGVVTEACKKTRVPRSDFYNWLQNDPDFASAVNGIGDVAIDFVESKLFQNVRDGREASAIFYLKTKGKKRGYVERQEITGMDGAPVVSNPYVNLDDASLLKLASELVKVNAGSRTAPAA